MKITRAYTAARCYATFSNTYVYDFVIKEKCVKKKVYNCKATEEK